MSIFRWSMSMNSEQSWHCLSTKQSFGITRSLSQTIFVSWVSMVDLLELIIGAWQELVSAYAEQKRAADQNGYIEEFEANSPNQTDSII